MQPGKPAIRLRIYLGEDKRDDERPLYQGIITKARSFHLSGATVLRGTQGFGRSTRLHTADSLFSEDLPVIIEIIDKPERLDPFIQSLLGNPQIGLITQDEVAILDCPAPPIR